MKGKIACFVALAILWIAPAYGMWSIAYSGTWPKSWPEELEPLRERSRSLTGGESDVTRYQIPFTTREEFEAAWPQILKVRSKGAPIVLFRGPLREWDKLKAGVCIQCPLGNEPVRQIPGVKHYLERWSRTTFIELIVDGSVVDLNRIFLPEDAPVIDKRFEDLAGK